MLAFIHLSDIHFNKYSNDSYDVDKDLRNEVLWDITYCCKSAITEINGILICGDIAFSGQAAEYKAASEFLEQICTELSIDRTHIFCVPGNHDVDQNITKNTSCVKLLQHQLENAHTQVDYDLCLAKFMRSPQDAYTLGLPIQNFNETFAARYCCDYTQDKLLWQQIMPIDAEHNLCLVGINSAMISSEEDHISETQEKKMRIGNCQIPERSTHTIYLSLCHHPPECWEDPGKILSEKMSNRVAVQLYGHKHVQKIEFNGKSLIVGSGATHPCRTYGEWKPRYNWITLDVDSKSGTPCLTVRIYSRVLNHAQTAFEPEKRLPGGVEYEEFQINLEEKADEEALSKDTNSSSEEELKTPKISVQSWERRFIYGFMNLPFFRRREILAELNLDRLADGETPHISLLDSYIRRAKEQGCVEQLLEEVRRGPMV